MPFNSAGLFEFEDIAFCNTNQFNEAARHFKKHGCYTRAPKGSREYNQFWDIEEDRLKNGMKAPGKLYTGADGIQRLQEVHITGEHYGFLNYARILRTKEDDIKELKNHVVGGDSILIKNAKKVGSKDMDFPSFIDGQYHWMKFKEEAAKLGLHILMTKARRKGFSYMEGWDSALTVNMTPYITVIIGAYDYKYITLGNQMMPMAKRYLDFLEKHTDFSRGYLREAVTEEIKLGYKKKETGNMEYGYQSSILALSFGSTSDAGIGKDVRKAKFEEVGRWPNLKKTLNTFLPTLRDGSIITGHLICFGVIGTEEADWSDFQDLYYSPPKEFAKCDNIWDEGSRGNGVGFFYPSYIGDPNFIDEHGNSQKEKYIEWSDKEREETKRTKTASEYIAEVTQDARTPREAFSTGSDNIFPSAEISEQLMLVENNDDYKHAQRCGRIVRTASGLKFKSNSELREEGLKVHDPVGYPLKTGDDVEGCYVEYMPLYRDPATGKIPSNLYRVWHDTYAHDKDKKDIKIKDSLGAAFIYERPNNFTPTRGDCIVGALVGRPPRIDDYNEHLLNVVEYVNGIMMFENDRGDVKGFFTRAGKAHLLADEPDLEWNLQAQGKTGRGKGMHMNDVRKKMGAIYLRDWLLTKRGKDMYGNDRLNLHYIRDAAFLRELLKWNLKGNFDRVSAFLVGMFDMKECYNKPFIKPKNNKNSIWNRKLF